MDTTEEIEKVTITKTQWKLLNDIRGLTSDAFYMIISAKEASNGYVLEGKTETLDTLRMDLYDECEIAPRSKLPTIQSLIDRLTPEYEDEEEA
jgi:hypothetical protein